MDARTSNLDTMNVMVGTDGHIQLSDMGAVADSTGNMAARKVNTYSKYRTVRCVIDDGWILHFYDLHVSQRQILYRI